MTQRINPTPAAIAEFLIDQHRPTLEADLKDMDDEAVGLSIAKAVEARFPGVDNDTLLRGLRIAAEVERADLAFNRGRA